MVVSVLLGFLALGWGVSGAVWRVGVGDGSFFCVFCALSFGLGFFFDRRFLSTLNRTLWVSNGLVFIGL